MSLAAARIAFSSASIAAVSPESSVPVLSFCTANSLILPFKVAISKSSDSAVCKYEIPSSALRAAIKALRPSALIW